MTIRTKRSAALLEAVVDLHSPRGDREIPAGKSSGGRFFPYGTKRIRQVPAHAGQTAHSTFIGIYWRAFHSLKRSQKIGGFVVAALLALIGWMVAANLKGRWLPDINQPILTSLGDHADHEFEYNPQKDMISFFRAFPQDPEMFLLDKIKVNLRRGFRIIRIRWAPSQIFIQLDIGH